MGGREEGRTERKKEGSYFTYNKLKGVLKILRRVNEISDGIENIMISQLGSEYVIVLKRKKKDGGVIQLYRTAYTLWPCSINCVTMYIVFDVCGFMFTAVKWGQ